MKNIAFLLLILNFFTSCLTDYETITRFYVSNESNKSIKIFVPRFSYEDEFYLIQVLDTTFLLNVGEKIEYGYVKDGKNNEYRYPFGQQTDTTLISVNDTITILYTRSDTIPRNILLLNSYSGGKVEDGLFEYHYIITDDDF